MKRISDCTVLVVDDTEANVDILVDALSHNYNITVAMDGETALQIADEEMPDIILLDIMMPGMDGHEVCVKLKENTNTKNIPVIFLTALSDIGNKTRGFKLGAVDYITKPFEIMEVQARVRTHLSLVLAKNELENQNEILEEKVLLRTMELQLTQDITVESMATLAEYRDPETGGHIRRTQNYVVTIAESLREQGKHEDILTPKAIRQMYTSAPLHDIGKVGVPDHILLKPGKLTMDEWTVMRRHTTIGRDALVVAEKKLGANSFLRFAREIAHLHHEKWDGSGYPEGLAEDAIPLAARIMALADVYDALISKRVYKLPFPHSQAVEIIMEGRGNHFDPDVSDAFLSTQENFRLIALEHSDFAEEREALSVLYR